MIKVFIIDGQHIFKEGLIVNLKNEPNIVIVGEMINGQNPIPYILKSNPHIIIIDIKYKGENKFNYVTSILKKYPQGKIMVLTNHKDIIYISKLLKICERNID
jgi:two-component system, NarL family, response regulator DegU